MRLNYLTLLITVAVLYRGSDAETLEVVVTNTRLPTSLAFITTTYDGDDSIYIWGGERDWINSDEIFKYSISKETVENVGRMPVQFRFGSGGWIENGGLVQFGGIDRRGTPDQYTSEVWSFEATSPSNWTVVTKLPTAFGFSTSVWDQNENFYIVGGTSGVYTYVNTIFKYSTVSQTVDIVGQLSIPFSSTAAVWDNTSRSLYTFGGRTSSITYTNDILKFNPGDGQVTKLNSLPQGIAYASAIRNGENVYIIGGYSPSPSAPSIVRYNPATNEVVSVPTTNFPSGLYSHGCVYVERISRVYIFGGIQVNGGRWRNEIMYIDLDDRSTPSTVTVEPTTLDSKETTTSTEEPTTKGSEDSTTPRMDDPTTETTSEIPTKPPVDFECPTEEGLYADPKNCRGFYNCAAWYPYHFCCPLPLFYNPAIKRCDFQDMVECSNDPGLPCDSPPGKFNL